MHEIVIPTNMEGSLGAVITGLQIPRLRSECRKSIFRNSPILY